MPINNTQNSYGWLTKTFHWTIALMIAAMFILGWTARTMTGWIAAPDIATTDATIATTKLLFSIHKTMGVAIFFLALLRIIWALSQPKPGLLNGDNWLEANLAETMHWLLYGSLVLVPLSGWVHHATSSGFAPIWWPFGQDLPLVPKSPAAFAISGAVHFVLQWVLAGAIILHVIGALKHHLIDRDATLRRMLPGQHSALPTARQPGRALPILTAAIIWVVALGLDASISWRYPPEAAMAEVLAEVQSDWAVEEGALDITIVQNNAEVTGRFADWTAEIAYDELPDATGKHGAVTVTIAIRSLTLGGVTDMAMGAGYFDADQWPTAVFQADLVQGDAGLIADGTLRIRDHSVPVQMPVSLQIDGDTAQAAGKLTVDRRDFAIGAATSDEQTLRFAVDIAWSLTASR